VGSARLRAWIVALAGAGLVCGVGLVCSSPPPPPPPPPTPEFSPDAAWEHLRALAEIGPRVPGTPGAAAAREYLRSRLDSLGIGVTEDVVTVEDRGDGQPIEVANLVGSIPASGDSPDLFLLAAGYDTTRFESFPFAGVNSGASGTALLLDLARGLAENPLPYGVRVVFLGAEAPQGDVLPEKALWSSRLLVERLRERGELERVRLAVYFDQVADTDLTIARDLRSHRRYRDLFFQSARELGLDAVFPPNAPFESVVTGHLAFWSVHFRRVVAITDPRYGGSDPPGTYWHTEQDTLERCSPQSLDAVGRVSRRALTEIATLEPDEAVAPAGREDGSAAGPAGGSGDADPGAKPPDPPEDPDRLN
jgi:hypothetical protein